MSEHLWHKTSYEIESEMKDEIAKVRKPHIQRADEEERIVRNAYLDRIAEAEARERRQREAYDQELIKKSEREGFGGMSEGQVLYEWRSRAWSRGSYPTGRRGMLEIWRPGAAAPASMVYGLPAAGQWIIRILKKDGTPSTLFDRHVFGWKKEAK